MALRAITRVTQSSAWFARYWRALLGIAAGGLTFGLVSPDVVRLLIGIVALAFSAYHYYRQWRPLDMAAATGG